MAQEKARLVMIGYHEGWSEEKMAKELKMTTREVDGIHGDLMDLGLLGKRVTDVIPAALVVRDRDMDQLESGLDRQTRDFAVLVQATLSDTEKMLLSLTGGKDIPQDARVYASVVGGILFGGMIDVFADDKTFMPAPPRRGQGAYYGWLVESSPALAGKIQREAWDSEGYQLVSIGREVLKERPTLDAMRRSGFVLDENDARRFRTYTLVTSRDKLLPFFKSQREDLLKAHRKVDSGRYASFATFFSWYYTMIVNRTIDRLVGEKKLATPDTPLFYALKTPAR
jgi:hypothetical protein